MVVVVTMGGSHAWCRAGGLSSPGYAWAHLNSNTCVFMESTRTETLCMSSGTHTFVYELWAFTWGFVGLCSS